MKIFTSRSQLIAIDILSKSKFVQVNECTKSRKEKGIRRKSYGKGKENKWEWKSKREKERNENGSGTKELL